MNAFHCVQALCVPPDAVVFSAQTLVNINSFEPRCNSPSPFIGQYLYFHLSPVKATNIKITPSISFNLVLGAFTQQDKQFYKV